MGLATYTELKQAIIDHLDRDDLASYVDDFIDLAEARHKREILVRDMLARAQSTLTGRYMALPARFIRMKTLRLMSDPVTVLTEVNLHEMNREREEGNGKPALFAIHEEIEFDTTPDDAYGVEMIYYKSFLPLDDDNTSNGLLARAPDAYLYGALVASAPFLASDERMQVWEALYGGARDGLILIDRQARFSTPLASRVVGATP